MRSALALISLSRKIKAIISDKVNYRGTQSQPWLWKKGLQKVVRWFLDADDNPYSHRNLIISFGPFTLFLEICMQFHSVVLAISRQINKQRHAKTINPLCAGNKVLYNIKFLYALELSFGTIFRAIYGIPTNLLQA